MKNRKQKFYEYEEKYGEIPENFQDRLEWMYDKYNITPKKQQEILEKRNRMMNTLDFIDIKVVLFEEPEGSPRPRFRIVNRYNLANMAMANSQFVHVYSITGKEDNMYMRRLLDSGELNQVQELLYTPCDVEFNAFVKTPNSFNTTDVFLAEIGLIRPTNKPDWDNIGKKYSDMFNSNIWLDDTLVVDGTVRKYYSIKPRVEVHLKYMNMLYNRSQYTNTIKRMETKDMDTSKVTYFDFNKFKS